MQKITQIRRLLPLIFLAACTAQTANQKESNSSDSDVYKPASIRVTPVHTAVARKGIFYYHIVCNGDIRAANTYRMIARTTGLIKSCKAKDGAYFSKGDVILQLETTPLKLQLQNAQLALRDAEAAYESRLLGYSSLLKGKTTDQIREIKEKLQISTGLSRAKLNVKNEKWNLQQAIIQAPASGITANVEVSTGMQVSPGTHLFTLYTTDHLLVDVLVLEEDVGHIAIGQQARVTPVGKDTATYTAVVSGINPVVNADGMATVHLTLKKTKGLFPGMHASATIEIPKQKTVIVPKSALVLRSGDRPVVFTVHDSLSKWHYVKPGLDNGQEVEILDGILPGDTVITSNNIQLAHDAPVRIDNGLFME